MSPNHMSRVQFKKSPYVSLSISGVKGHPNGDVPTSGGGGWGRRAGRRGLMCGVTVSLLYDLRGRGSIWG